MPNVVLCDNRLSTDARIVYALILEHTRPDRPDCWASQERLRQLLGKGWNRRRVQKAIYELRDADLITCQRGDFRRTNTYILQPLPDQLLVALDPKAIQASAMPKLKRRTRPEEASQRVASDAPVPDAGFPAVQGAPAGICGHQGNGYQKGLIGSSEGESRAQRSSSSSRVRESSSDVGCAVDVVGGLQGVNAQEDVEENEACIIFEKFELGKAKANGHQQGALQPTLGRQLSDGCWRCEHCGWLGSFEELLPRRFGIEPWLTYLCPNCRWLRGIAVLENTAGEQDSNQPNGGGEQNAEQDDPCSDRDGGRCRQRDGLVLERLP